MWHTDYYETLGISSSATQDQIKEAYRALARTLHPDVNHESNANSVFAKITEAYSVLSKPDVRSKYDHWLLHDQSDQSASQFDLPPNPFAVLFPNLQPIERAPAMGSWNGIGVRPYGTYNPDIKTGSFETILYFTIFFIPLLTLGRYRVINLGASGCFPIAWNTRYIFLGRIPITAKDWGVPAVTLPIALIFLLSYVIPGIQASELRSQQINSLNTQIDSGQVNIDVLAANLLEIDAELTDYDSRITDMGNRLDVIERNASLGIWYDRNAYEQQVNEYNRLIEEYNALLEEFQRKKTTYEQEMNRVNAIIDEYNRLNH